MADQSDRGIYILGGAFGIVAGVLDVKVGDLLLTALFVLAATMLLGALRPQRPWRWTLLVAAFVPLVQLVAYAVLTEKPYRAQIYRIVSRLPDRSRRCLRRRDRRRGLGELWRK